MTTIESPTMPWYVFLPMLLISLPGVILVFLSYGHLSEYGNDRFSKVLALGVFANRSYFTKKGWKYRNLGGALGLIGVLLSWILMSRQF